jgi:hypothetical protein
VKTLPPAGRTRDIGDAIFDRTILRCDESIINDIDPVQFDIVLGGVERVLRLSDLFVCSVFRGNSGIFQLSLPIEQFDRCITPRDERASAVEFLLGKLHLRLLLREIGLGLVERATRLLHQGCVLFERRLQILCIHHRDDLTRPYQIALIGKERQNAPRKLGVYVDFVGLEPAIAPGDAGQQARSQVKPPITSRSRGGQQHEGQHSASEPAPSSRPIRHRRHHRRQSDGGRRPDDLGTGCGALGGDIGSLVCGHRRDPSLRYGTGAMIVPGWRGPAR